MPNHYFKFKQFTIFQDACAMKVCTDACLLGALVADEINKVDLKYKHSLDIGAGTGLLSLMLAQKNTGQIEAVEIDEAAFEQAKSNFSKSEFKDRLNILNVNILHFVTEKKYDCIISNPPFFESDLKSRDPKKNNAKHDTALTLLQLFQKVKSLLNSIGIFATLLPYHRINYAISEAEKNGLFVYKNISVRQTVNHDYFRSILFFKSSLSATENIDISIKDESGNYSNQFIQLLKDYYLNL